jgi:DNA-directed RNA polymerase specialized sigma24 family protein
VGQGRGGHAHDDDELGRLAGAVIARVRPNRGDRDSVEDCFQEAYLAGLLARRAAHRRQQHTSSSFLFLAMQSAVYRLLRVPSTRKEIRESDLQICA